MNISTFAKPGEKNVMPVNFYRTVKVGKHRLSARLAPHCWVRGNRLAFVIRGRIGSAVVESKHLFQRATWTDVETALKRIRLASCRWPGCKREYLVDSREKLVNPKKLCERHRKADWKQEVAKVEKQLNKERAVYDAKKKTQGFRYLAIFWIHSRSGDKSAAVYFKTKPSKALLIKEGNKRRANLSDTVTVAKL